MLVSKKSFKKNRPKNFIIVDFHKNFLAQKVVVQNTNIEATPQILNNGNKRLRME